MINLIKLLRFWDKPKPEQSDLRPSERHGYIQELRHLKEQHCEAIEWWKHNDRYFRLTIDAQIIEIAKLKAHILRLSLESDTQVVENHNLKEKIAKKATPKKGKKK